MTLSKTEKKLRRSAQFIRKLADQLGDPDSPIPGQIMAKAKRVEKRKREQFRRDKA